MQIGRLWQSYL